MAQEVQYTANTGWATISTANANLDGTGTLGTVLTAASRGTIIKTVIIKSQTTTQNGMVRLFVDPGGGISAKLIAEINIPIVTKSSRDFSYYNVIPMNYELKAGYILKASTEKNDTFNIIAEGLDYTYGATVREDSTEGDVTTGTVSISTANTNLDGTGTIGTVLTAGSSPTYKGCMITSIIIKALGTTTAGMVRLYILQPANTAKLFAEVFIPANTANATNESFVHQVIAQGSLSLKTGYSLQASTEKGEAFSVTAEALDWFYPA